MCTPIVICRCHLERGLGGHRQVASGDCPLTLASNTPTHPPTPKRSEKSKMFQSLHRLTDLPPTYLNGGVGLLSFKLQEVAHRVEALEEKLCWFGAPLQTRSTREGR